MKLFIIILVHTKKLIIYQQVFKITILYCDYVKQLFIFALAKKQKCFGQIGEVGEWLNPPVC